MHSDPIADLLTRIRNAIRAHHATVTVPYSTVKDSILKVMKESGFIEDYSTFEEGKFKNLKIDLNEEKGEITLTRVSKPGQRIYLKKSDLKPVKSGLGIQILSTSKGVMTSLDAWRQNLGGEVICEIH